MHFKTSAQSNNIMAFRSYKENKKDAFVLILST